MTLVLTTDSHGPIESGYLGPFVHCTKLGDYQFATDEFCELTTEIASDPFLRNARITNHNLDSFLFSGVISDHETIPVAINENTITIGKYEIPSSNFSFFSWYVARGGFLGWRDFGTPDFADKALKAIENSKHPIYRELQKTN
jgi:hypothetical protein